MNGTEHGEASLCQVEEELHQVRCCKTVQATGGLVKEKHCGRLQQLDCNCQPTQLAARELMDLPILRQQASHEYRRISVLTGRRIG